MPPSQIVVGVDFSAPSLAAARWMARYFGNDAALVLAHAVCVPEPPAFLRGFFAPTQPLIEDARRGGQARLEELIGSLPAARVRAEVRVGGRPHEVLSSVADELQADLLVVGAHGERPGIWRLLGSTAEHIARRARTSVFLARGLPPEGLRTILVALDESEVTSSVIEWTSLLARRFGAKVIAVHVVHRFLHGPTLIAASPSERNRAEEQLHRRTEEWLRQQVPSIGDEAPVVEALFGDAGLEILSAVERYAADLLVIGRHGARPASGGFLGSVAEFLLRNGSGAVLTVSGFSRGQ
jgi:nucleotide-binding universal stress UspA family protein